MIIHADMDAFYVSVELLERPDLKDQPVAVGGALGTRGVISAANYIARRYGVHSALPTATAMQRCPHLVLLKPRLSVYADMSRKIQDVFERYTPLVEPLSLDEAFLDVSAVKKLFGDAEHIARNIKHDIAKDLNLTVSVGVAPTKFVAKIASDINKPDGFCVVTEEHVQAFLDPLPVARIWGVGKKSEEQLKQRGIHTLCDLRCQSENVIEQWFGKQGLHWRELAQGIDPRSVISDRQAKSISHERTFAADIRDQDYLLSQLLHLTELVAARLRRYQHCGRTVNIKVRYPDFTTLTRAKSLPHATNSTDEIWQAAKLLFIERLAQSREPLRLIGIGVSGFDDTEVSGQRSLFEENQPVDTEIDKVTDAINRRFGAESVKRGFSSSD